jgi:restriction system protein
LSIPDFQSLMLPLLKFTGDSQEHSMAEARDALVQKLSLSESDVKELLPSGKQTIFGNRVAWSKVYLSQAGLLESPKRGVFKITPAGISVLKSPPEKITIKFLEQFEEFKEFRYERKGSRSEKPNEIQPEQSSTPEEALEQAAESLREELAQQLLKQIKQNSPVFFERLVVDLLVKMGYGGSIKDAGQAIGQSGDEGIDGIIKEDKLGLDLIYIQAKRWESSVGRPELQKFVGALHGKRARKGVFITTSYFSQQAIDYVNQVDPSIVLIDGGRLVNLMLDHNLGVSVTNTIEIKKLDSDYFIEE